MDKYEELDGLLNRASQAQTDWVTQLQDIRAQADVAVNEGSIAHYQWQALVSRSARIQDRRNGD